MVKKTKLRRVRIETEIYLPIETLRNNPDLLFSDGTDSTFFNRKKRLFGL